MSDIYRTAPVPTIGESYEIGRAHGARAEQERIIKLLATAECQGEDDWCATIEQAIALIEGEK